MRSPLAPLALGFALASGCRRLAFVEPEPGWERMGVQPRANAYDPSDFFADGKVLQRPPPGTVAREQRVGDPVRTAGVVDGRFVEHVPVPVDRAFVARGRDRFDVFCAPCHGIAGDGVSVVAQKMSLRRPPSLHEPRYRQAPAGELFQVIGEGFGLMPSYADVLPEDDRWAVVAYVRALQLSRHAPAADLPEPVRRELAREAP